MNRKKTYSKPPSSKKIDDVVLYKGHQPHHWLPDFYLLENTGMILSAIFTKTWNRGKLFVQKFQESSRVRRSMMFWTCIVFILQLGMRCIVNTFFFIPNLIRMFRNLPQTCREVQTKDGSKPPGLYNIGNTCFYNAVIQDLYRTRIFTQYLKELSLKLKQSEIKKRSNCPAISSDVVPVSDSQNGSRFFRYLLFPFKCCWNTLKSLTSVAIKRFYIASTVSSIFFVFLLIPCENAACRKVKAAMFCFFQLSLVPFKFCWVIYKILAGKSQYVDTGRDCVKIVFPNNGDKITVLNDFVKRNVCLTADDCFVAEIDSDSHLLGSCTNREIFAFCTLTSFLLIVYFVPFRFMKNFGFRLLERWSQWWMSSRLANHRPETLTGTLAELFEDMDERKSCDPSAVFDALCKRSSMFCGGHQQDSHELLRHLLDGIREEERGEMTGTDRLTIVDKIFGGHFFTTYTCCKCKTPYHLCEPFLDISLPIIFHADPNEMKDTDDFELITTRNDDKADDYKKAIRNIMTPIVGTATPSKLRSEERMKTDWTDKAPDTRSNESGDHTRSTNSRPYRVSDGAGDYADASNDFQSVDFFLKVLTRKELLDEEYLCASCNEGKTGSDYLLTSGTKQTLIYDPPAVLCIHLKRFQQTAQGFAKVDKFVPYSKLMDLASYCSSQSHRIEKDQMSVKYSLYGVVVHSGSLNGGHYTAYVKQRKEGNEEDAKNLEFFLQQNDFRWEDTSYLNYLRRESSSKGSSFCSDDKILMEPDEPVRWFYCSDTHVEEVKELEVLQQQAYLLFYERI